MSALSQVIDELEHGERPAVETMAALAGELGGVPATVNMFADSPYTKDLIVLYIACLSHRQQSEV